MFEPRGEQLSGPWLSFLPDQPLVSLMNCSVSEWLITPFLQVPVVHVGGLFVEQSVRRSFSLQHVRVSHGCVSFSGWTRDYGGKKGFFSDFLLHQAFYCAGSQDFHIWSEL